MSENAGGQFCCDIFPEMVLLFATGRGRLRIGRLLQWILSEEHAVFIGAGLFPAATEE